MSNDELEASIRELGTNNTKCLPTEANDDTDVSEILESNDSNENEDEEKAVSTHITSPVAAMLSKYYSPAELNAIENAITPKGGCAS